MDLNQEALKVSGGECGVIMFVNTGKVQKFLNLDEQR